MAVDRTDSLEARAERGVFGIHIEGCPYFWVDTTPVDPSGDAWAAPLDWRGESYTVEEALQVREGIASTDSTWKPKEGLSEGGSFSVRLAATDNVREWFATEKSGRVYQEIQADTDYDASGVADEDRYAVYVDDETEFDSSGYVYVGRETIHYDAVDATEHTLGDTTAATPADWMDRGCWNWQTDSELSRHHYSATDAIRMTTVASSHPEVHRGRRVTVLYWQADEHGRCYDDAYKGEHEIEIRSGYIKNFGPAADNWTEFEIQCDDLTSSLQNDIGAPLVSCDVPAQPGTIQFTDDAWVEITLDVVAGGTATPLAAERVAVLNPDDSAVGAGLISLERYAVALAYTVQKTVNAVNADTLITGGSIAQGTGEDGSQVYYPQMLLKNDSTGTASDEYNHALIVADFGGVSLGVEVGSVDAPYAFSAVVWPFYDYRGAWQLDYAWTGGIDEGATTLTVKPVIEDAVEEDFPSSGYAKLTSGDMLEWVYYDSVTTGAVNGVADGYVRLNVTERGMFNTPPQSFSPSADGSFEFTVEIFYGWDRAKFGDILAQILLSTGTTGAYGSDDVLSRKYGLGLDPASVDIDAIKNSDRLQSERTWLLADETSMENVVKDEAILNGFVLTARTDKSGRYRLTVAPVEQPSLVASSGSFSVLDGTITSPHQKMRRTTGSLINEVKCSVSLDPTGETTGPTYRVIDTGGREIYGESKTLTVKMRGLNDEARSEVNAAAYRLFFLFGRPYWVLEFETDRSGLAIQPGNTVSVTIPGVWTPAGSTGFTAQPGTVLQIRKNWFAAGDQSATRMSVVLFPPARGIAPTFEVDSYDSGTPSITIADNVFTDDTDASPFGLALCRDWHHGPPDGETWPVWVYQRGDIGSREPHTVTSDGTATWTLDSALIMTVGSSDTLVEFADYTHASIADLMKLYAYIADADKALGALDDSAHTWAA